MAADTPRLGSLAWAVATAEARACALSDVFLAREAREGGRDQATLLALMGTRLAVMRASLRRGLASPQRSRSGLTDGGAWRLAQWAEAAPGLLGPLFSRLVASALAVAEVNACMGRVVAAPTAGSCGVLPAALLTVAEARGLDDAALVRSLVTAGGIGLAIEHSATLSGAEGGCQAEVGSASAMAAGALVELCGGTPRQAEHAVAFALGNLLGLVCDPVGGLVDVPCAQRNAVGAVNAVACAEMALAGLPALFRADAVIETMGKVGRRLPEELRETARGGLAALPWPPAPDASPL